MESLIFGRPTSHAAVEIESPRQMNMTNFSGNTALSIKVFPILILSAFWGSIFSSNTATAQPRTKQHLSSKAGLSNSDPDTECQRAGPKGCVQLAIDAIGGQDRLERIKSLGVEAVRHTLLTEQSYRQDPFITSYERLKIKVDFVGNRIYRESHLTWPESDPGDSESDSIVVAGLAGGVRRASADAPCSLADLDWVREELSLGPARLLLTALQSSDLRFGEPEMLRSTMHTTLLFTWQGINVKVAINRFNHLPDALETTEQFQDHWYQWGDVQRKIYFDNWKTFHGIVYPTNEVEERNGILWRSTQVLNLDLNVPIEDAQFRMDPKAMERSTRSKGWESNFPSGKGVDLAPGITLYESSWNATIVKQQDGIVILETPLSGTYADGLIQEAKRRYPGIPINAVLSTSDSWPHVGGVRQAVALNLPVYILDLNQPLLDRLVKSPRKLHPDLLAQSPKAPAWRIVSGKLQVGKGENRMELYPIRGGSTERQYMVYFPEHHLLYASDTLSLNDNGTLYDPELMREVAEAVKREGLQVEKVFAMHQGPVPWPQVMSLVEKALN
jgi:hypothetical protein